MFEGRNAPIYAPMHGLASEQKSEAAARGAEELKGFLAMAGRRAGAAPCPKVAVLRLAEPHFANVKNQSKRYLLRAACNFVPGDMLILLPAAPEGNEATYYACITETKTYPSFKAAISDTPLDELLPGIKTVAEAVQSYKALSNHPDGGGEDTVTRHRLLRV